jgi:hypothetical protein
MAAQLKQEQRENKAAVEIQKNARMLAAKKEANRLRKERDDAIALQKVGGVCFFQC